MTIASARIAVVGATGAVGGEMLALLTGLGVPADRVTPYASARSAGSEAAYGDKALVVRDTAEVVGGGHTLVLMAASSGVAREFAPRLVAAGAVVVDNSSAYRMAERTPLVVPEVNGDVIRGDGTPRVIANPNCSTIMMLVAADPIRRAFGCTRLLASTYQAASGAGIEAMEELRDQTAAVLRGEEAVPRVFDEPCAFNAFSHNSAVDPETGLNVEETKMIEETRKIWGDESVVVQPTCIRVPVLRAHCESITITTREEATLNGVRTALADAPGVELLDDRAANAFPTPLKASGGSDVLVGRVRVPEPKTVQLFCAGDQLLKGAALNAVQIAQLVLGGSPPSGI